MRTRTVPEQSYQAGSYSFDLPASVGKRFIGLELSLSRVNWPAGVDHILSDGSVVSDTAVAIMFGRSEDNGQTWIDAGGATFSGGVKFRTDGQLITHSTAKFSWRSAGQPVEQHGDLRINIDALVPITTEVVVSLRELGDA